MVAVVVGVAYEAVVAVSGFFAVIARDVSSRWQVRLADRVDLFLLRKAAHFERRYREFVLGGLRFMDHKGLATVGSFSPELNAVFVDVSLIPRPPQHIGPGILPGPDDERTGRRVLDDFLGREMPAVLAVVGGPGSGKTTLLRHAARQACLIKRSRNNRRSPVRDIPILLYLRDHVTAIKSKPTVSVANLLRSTLGEVAAEESPEWFEQKLREGRCLVLLDGLDEVARQEDRGKVSAWAERQIQQYPGNDFVISSRPKGYQSAPIEGADIVQVCGFTASQAEAFVRGWYRAVVRHSTGAVGPEVETLAADGASDLLQRLEQTPALYDLTVNPLLLTMIANVHKYRGALPGTRADLYAEISQAMLWRRQDAKNLPQQMSGPSKEVVLRSLAYTMMKHRVSDLPRADVLAETKGTLQRMSGSVTPEDFLADVSSNGLLVERETGQYAFAHQTFQEYLAAAHIRDRGLVGVLADAVSDDWWSEVTLLYAATSNADPIIRACLIANSAPALALALDCTEQDSDVDPALRNEVHALVISAAKPHADQERRRLFAGVLLSRHMRQRERTRWHTQVCTRPISAEIYRLFLADTWTAEPDAPMVESGTAVGMRSTDATAFVHWVNALSTGQPGYRLPMADELTELASHRHIPLLPSNCSPCAWTQAHETSGQSQGTLLWCSQGQPDPYKLNSAYMASACKSDLIHSTFTLTGLVLWARIQLRVLNPYLEPRLSPVALGLTEMLRALNRADASANVRSLVSTLDRELEAVNKHDLRNPRHLSRALDKHLEIAQSLDISRARARTRAPDLAGPLDQDHEIAHNFAISVDAGLRLVEEIYAIVSRSVAPGSLDSSRQQAAATTCRLVLGKAFSEAITQYLRSGLPGTLNDRFTAAFAYVTGAERVDNLTANPATMEITLLESVGKLADTFDEIGQSTIEHQWSSAIVAHLRTNTLQVFNRTEQLTAEKAMAGRLAALCLAAEADGRDRKDIGDMFRQVAAGITLLEYRATGELHATEVIMLALEPSPSEMLASIRRGHSPKHA
jgi:hypothetical protein